MKATLVYTEEDIVRLIKQAALKNCNISPLRDCDVILGVATVQGQTKFDDLDAQRFEFSAEVDIDGSPDLG